ncbi:MAG: FAD:protein FMN transferase [Anaerolineae bacterium]|nr:FAD:protein FMN transferase [Anaerolineae bacterium]
MTIGMGAQVTRLAMGTVMTHKAFGRHAEECLNAVCAEVVHLEKILSRFLPESDISRINRSAGIQCENVSLDTYEVLSQAVEFSRKGQGCFKVTIGPLVTLWNGYKETATPPDESSIRQVLPLVNDRDLVLDLWPRTAGLKKGGQSIDLGGIGKGFAGDRIREVFKKFGLSSAYSNLGGNVVALGAKPDGRPWQIGIQHPRQENSSIGSVSVVNQTVVTSGDYQRYFTDNQGKRRHHILNPTTGYPAESGLISVSIVSDKSLAADALSTILFVAGMEKGLGFLRSFPQTEAVLVDSDLQVYVTPGLRYRFEADKGVEVIILN